jgi:hypothetical protein
VIITIVSIFVKEAFPAGAAAIGEQSWRDRRLNGWPIPLDFRERGVYTVINGHGIHGIHGHNP